MGEMFADFARMASLGFLAAGIYGHFSGAPIEEWAIWYFTAIYLRLQALEWSRPTPIGDKTHE